eukprot:GEMP01003660.1.p1 GENE.GEMP01003660.1~~GEMP01003660.1.p1  ORF type:complete len:1236 (+),score=251.02 GEMP01003660.1:160-3867(+)
MGVFVVTLFILARGDSIVDRGLSPTHPSIDDSNYAAFSYHFNIRRNGKEMKGRGQAYVDTVHHLFRLTGKSNPNFGKTEITVIIDGRQKVVTTYLNLEEENESQCVIFPFPVVSDEKKRLTNLSVGDHNNIPWVRGREIHLSWFMKNLTGVSVSKGQAQLREYEVDSWQSEWSPDEVLDPPFLPKFDVDDKWECIEVSKVNDRLARLGLRWPHHDSLALGDLIAAASLNRPDLFMRAALALPGDLAVSIEAPNPPDFKEFDAVSFDYETSDFQVEPPHVSSGTLWVDSREQLLKIRGKTNSASHGEVTLAVTIFGEKEAVVSYIELPDGATGECLWYDYPSRPKGLLDGLSEMDEESLSFQGVVDLEEHETSHFVAQLLRKRLLHLYIDQDTDRVWRVEVVFANGKQLQTDISKWKTYKRAPPSSAFQVPEPCQKDDNVEKTEDEMTQLRLKSPHGKSLALVDALFALSFTTTHRQAVLLNAFALPGEVKLMVDAPAPPNLSFVSQLSFHYETFTSLHGYPFRGHVTKMHTTGKFAFNAVTSELMLQGDIAKMPQYGEVNATVIIQSQVTNGKGKGMGVVYSRMTWSRPSRGNQCIITQTPKLPDDIADQLMKQQNEPVRFLSVEHINHVECNLFQIKMSHGRLMVLAVDRDAPDRLVRLLISAERHPWEPRSLVYFYNWTTVPPPPAVFQAPPAWHCLPREEINDPVLSGPGLDQPDRKAISLGDSIFAMSQPLANGKVLGLPILALPADLDLMMRRPTSVDPGDLQYLYTEFTGRTDDTGRFRGHFALDLSSRQLVVKASSTRLSAMGALDMSILITGNSLFVTTQFGEPIKAYCFAYSLEPFTKVESPSSWSEVHFLGAQTARDGAHGLDAECHVFDVNIPGSKLARLRIFKAVDDNEVIRMEIGKPGADPIVIVHPTVWRTHPRPDPDMFRAPLNCAPKEKHDLVNVLAEDNQKGGRFPPILEAVSRAQHARTPPLYLLALPGEWPHFASHVHRVCITTTECQSAEVPIEHKHKEPSIPLSPPLTPELPLEPGPVMIVPLGTFLGEYSFKFDSRYSASREHIMRGMGEISVSVPRKSFRMRGNSAGSLSPGVGRVDSLVILEGGLLTVQTTLNARDVGPCVTYDVNDDDFGSGSGLASAALMPYVIAGHNYAKSLGHRTLHLAISGSGPALKLTSMAIADPFHKNNFPVSVEVSNFVSVASPKLAEMKIPDEKCIRGGALPSSWDPIRVFF